MRSGSATTHARLLRLFRRHSETAQAARLSRVRVDDDVLRGDIVTVDGSPLVNFGSCAYLGLNLDERLKNGAVLAIDRYGPVFSSSTAYTSIPLYTELEDALSRITERHVVVSATTTLAHLACLPVLVGPDDVVVVDAQAHASVHMATQQLAAESVPITVVAHNDFTDLDAALETLTGRHERVWYLADGIYSMYGDTVPVEALRTRLDRHPNLWAYIDDAHGFGWYGRNGRGLVLEDLGHHDRVIVAASLAKSFGSGGGALFFPDAATAERVLMLGGTLTFSGPMHPAELGAAVASAGVHLSETHAELRRRIDAQIDLVATTAMRLGLPLHNVDHTPIWFLQVGRHDAALELGVRMMKEGFFLNLASFPAVPPNRSGLRFTNTLYHSADQIVSMLEALRTNLDLVGAATTGLDIDLTNSQEARAT